MKIKNIGKVSGQWLKEIDVNSYEDLKQMGSIEAGLFIINEPYYS